MITRAGPRGATYAQQLPGRGQPPLVALVVEVWGAGDRRADLEARLAAGLWRAIQASRGSHTARLRSALQEGHRWLGTLAGTSEGPLGAGASLVLVTNQETLLAQAGPSLAFASGAAGPVQYPPSSPWLQAGLTSPDWHPAWPALGQGREAVIHWATLVPVEGQHLLLASTAAASSLDPGTQARLFTAADADLAPTLDAVLSPAITALLISWPRSAPAPAASTQPPPASSMVKDPTAGSSERAAVPPAWVPALARASQTGAKILAGLLPARPPGTRFAAERSRLAAAAAIGLPMVVLAMALAHGRDQGGQVGPQPAPAAAAPPLAGPTAAVQDDPALRILRLNDLTAVASLPGGEGDDRQVVAFGEQSWVLNRDLDQVDRIAAGEVQPVLYRGQVVGDALVGALEDLIVVPGGEAGDLVLGLDAAGALWRVDGPLPETVSRAEQPVWQSVGHLAGFAGNLYAVDRSVGQIWRYQGQVDGYTSPGTAWLADPLPMRQVIDVAIDGNVYLLEKDKTVRKLANGAPVPFRLATPPGGLAQAQTLQAPGPDLGLLLTDPAAGRLLRFAADGSYVHQILAPPVVSSEDEAARAGRFRNLRDAWWDVPAGRLYLVAGPWLYVAPYAPLAATVGRAPP